MSLIFVKSASAGVISSAALAIIFWSLCVFVGHSTMESIFGAWLVITVPCLVAAFVWYDGRYNRL